MTKSKRKKVFKDFFQKFAVIFTVVVLVLAAAGLLVTHVNFREIDFSKFFNSEKTGLLFKYILIPAGIIFLVILFIFITKALIKKHRNRYDELFRHHHIYHKKKII